MLCHRPQPVLVDGGADGRALSENYSFKRIIHGIHGNSNSAYPFTHGNDVIGAFNESGVFTLDGLIAASSSSSVSAPLGTLQQPSSTGVVVPGTALGASGSDGAGELCGRSGLSVGGPGLQWLPCEQLVAARPGPAGAWSRSPIDQVTLKAGLDPLNWLVITPRAASCTYVPRFHQGDRSRRRAGRRLRPADTGAVAPVAGNLRRLAMRWADRKAWMSRTGKSDAYAAPPKDEPASSVRGVAARGSNSVSELPWWLPV